MQAAIQSTQYPTNLHNCVIKFIMANNRKNMDSKVTCKTLKLLEKNVEGKTIKLLEVNWCSLGKRFRTKGGRDEVLVVLILKACSVRGKSDQLTLITMENFCSAKDAVKGAKRQARE